MIYFAIFWLACLLAFLQFVQDAPYLPWHD